ncbi:MAG: PstA family ABC transporter permease [Akkermansiaceae bacterium]
MARSEANPFRSESSKRKVIDRVGTGVFAFFTYFILACVLSILGKITWDGAPVIFQTEAPFINTEFFSNSPMTLHEFHNEEGELVRLDKNDFDQYKKENPDAVIRDEHTFSYAGGGILGPLVGTAMLVILCMVAALFIGISAAIYLNEYARKGRVVTTIRLAIMNLAGVPSIVFGLFGFAFFCFSPIFPVVTQSPDWERCLYAVPLWPTEGYLSFQGWGKSVLAGAATLAVMVLPVIIAACEESLKAVPKGFREASLALGATRWQCIRTAVLPYATPGILTASVLGVTRVAGETAPIMFTAAVASKGKLPWQDTEGSGLYWMSNLLTQMVEALPYHIYTVSGKLPANEALDDMRYGSVFVFLLFIVGFAMISVVLRSRFRNKLKW